MNVRRIVANVTAADVGATAAFYGDVFGLETLMDLGWVRTLGKQGAVPVQLSVVSAGAEEGAPTMSIEVDDLDDALGRARAAGCHIVYGPADEPWGVRRFFVRDPAGTLVNVLCHAEEKAGGA